MNPGVLEDTRPEEEKEKDWSADEVLTTSAPAWKEKSIKELKQFPIWSQNGSGQCVAFSKAKQVSIEVMRLTGVWIDFSPVFIYKRRQNQSAGMWVHNANDIVIKQGTTLEAFMKSQNLTEQEANSVKETATATVFAEGVKHACQSYLYVNGIDKIATVLDMGHAVSLNIFADRKEYTDMPEVLSDIDFTTAEIRHQVTAVDYFVKDDKKCLLIEDSWGVGHGQGGRRIFTEDFVDQRVKTADYFDRFILNESLPKKYTFYKNLQFGNKNGQVVLLQNFLKERGYFPTNQASTGYYGQITARAVLKWQLDNNIDTREELLRLGGKYFGPKSRQNV